MSEMRVGGAGFRQVAPSRRSFDSVAAQPAGWRFPVRILRFPRNKSFLKEGPGGWAQQAPGGGRGDREEAGKGKENGESRRSAQVFHGRAT